MENGMKLATASDDEMNVSQHFGRAPCYVVFTVDDGKVTAKETRSKASHQTFAAHVPAKLAEGERHGYDAGSRSRHANMAEAIRDCQVLLAGGMGWGAYEAMQGYGIETIATDIENIDEAVELYLAGKLANVMNRLH